MLRLNKKTEYGMMALIHLASVPSRAASVREISTQYHIPMTLLSKIMQSMKGVGIVDAVHGNHGGYHLSRELSEITVLDLNQVLVGPVQIAECLEPGSGDCPAKHHCSIMTPMNQLNHRLIHLFKTTSLDSLVAAPKEYRGDR